MTNFTFHTIETTSEEAKPILEKIQKDYGFIPNLFAYMAEAPTTLEAYLTLNKIIEKTSLTPAQQQVALLAASVENECDFCTIAHRAIGKMKQANEQTLNALNAKKKIHDDMDAALAKFTQSVVKDRGNLSEETINEFLNAGFIKKQILEVMIIVSIKTLSNYINHLTKPESNKELLAMI